MDNLARKLNPSTISQEVGCVLGVEDGTCLVRTSSGDWRAQTAASCLLAPEVGDHVLLAVIEPTGCYVLAILERTTESPARIILDGDLELVLPDGQMRVNAHDGMQLATEKSCAITAKDFTLTAITSTLLSQQLDLIGGRVHAQLAEISAFAASCDTMFDRVVQRAKHAFRFVSQTEQVRAERLDYAADESIRLHAKDTLITSDQLLKADADQIHLG